MLAVLMGGGLVLFGIGGDVSGGLFDAFSDRNANSSNADSTFRDRADQAEKKLKVNPRDEGALKQLVRARYQLATQEADPETGQFTDEGKKQLEAAGRAWDRYIALPPKKVDDSLAGLMLQAYSPNALNQPEKGQRVAQTLAETRETPEAYVLLVQYASLAGDKRTADLAGQKALDLAPRSDRSSVKEQVEQAKAASAIQELQQQQGG
jgi:hypothetical protein